LLEIYLIFKKGMMVQENSIELEKKEDIEKKQIQKKKCNSDRAVDRTQKAVDGPCREKVTENKGISDFSTSIATC